MGGHCSSPQRDLNGDSNTVNARNADEQVTHAKAASPTDFQAPGQPDLNDPQSAERHIEEKVAFDEARGRATRVRIIFFCLQIAC